MRRLMILPCLLAASIADAAVFTVDTSSDLAGDDCMVGACSLRGAITAANLTPAGDQIEFDIPEADPGYQPTTQHWLILVGATALPAITAAVVIDGYTQAGAVPNAQSPDQGGLNGTLKIEIRGNSASSSQQDGLAISLNNFAQAASTFRGLAISRFQSQILLYGSSAHRVEGCYLGTDISGAVASMTGNGNPGSGVRVQGPGPYLIGGMLPGERNLISGVSNGVLFQSASDGIRIQGNLIGTDASGTVAIGNRDSGISSTAPLRNARIGGVLSSARNLISATQYTAIYLSGQGATDFDGTAIEGNYLGTDITGTKRIGNGLNPSSPSQPLTTIMVFSGSFCNLTIGGNAPGQANLIAYGGAAGVTNDSCRGLSMPLNHYRGNRGIPFDNIFGGGANGATPNDLDDVDEQGGNRLQNFPEITLPAGFLNQGGTSVALQYRVDTAIANATYPISVHFYRGACGGGSSALLASDTITSAQAQQLLAFNLVSTDGANLLPLIAMAVDAAGNASEFSPMLGDSIFAGDFEDTPAPAAAGSCP